MGRLAVDQCAIVDSPQQLMQASTSAPASYCHNTPPYRAQWKLLGSKSLPWDLRASGTFQYVPGPAIAANYFNRTDSIAINVQLTVANEWEQLQPVLDVWTAAHKYHIPALEQECSTELETQLTRPNVAQVMQAALTFGDDQLDDRRGLEQPGRDAGEENAEHGRGDNADQDGPGSLPFRQARGGDIAVERQRGLGVLIRAQAFALHQRDIAHRGEVAMLGELGKALERGLVIAGVEIGGGLVELLLIAGNQPVRPRATKCRERDADTQQENRNAHGAFSIAERHFEVIERTP